MPEPSFPPPPPPKWQPSPQTAPSIPPSRPQPPQSQDTWDPPPPTRDNWKSTTGNSVSTWQQSNNTANHGNVGRPLKHESSEDWDEDDDWDDEDDDSVVSGEMVSRILCHLSNGCDMSINKYKPFYDLTNTS